MDQQFVSDFCDGDDGFKPLAPYLKNISVSTFLHCPESTLVRFVPDELRIIIGIFLEFVRTNTEDTYFEKNICEGKIIFLSGRIARITRENNSQISDIIQKALPKGEKVGLLKLSGNNLRDNDLKEILAAAHLHPEGILAMDLSSNLIYGKIDTESVDQQVIQLIDTIKYHLVIFHNPIATIVRKDFFKKLQEEHFDKLIWIPPKLVMDTAWEVMVPRIHIERIRKVHRNYFFGQGEE